MSKKFTFLEFFAGGGLVRVGLGPRWQCLLANEWSETKAATYRRNFPPAKELVVCDIRNLKLECIASKADMAWGSFPCQDLSVAGPRSGFNGERSSTFWSFWLQMKFLQGLRRLPSIVVLENVVGALTTNRGKDFREIFHILTAGGYRVGPLVADAVHFLPHSRPRLFIVAIHETIGVPETLSSHEPIEPWHTASIRQAFCTLERMRSQWIWWKLPTIEKQSVILRDIVEDAPSDVDWHSPSETAHLLNQMSALHFEKVAAAQRDGGRHVGTVYRRTRVEKGQKVLRAEVRFDGVSGCLRTPAGGASRQIILVVEGQKIRSRLISSREGAALMGLPTEYELPERYSDAYHLLGDGVAVPVVRFLAQNIFEPLLESMKTSYMSERLIGRSFDLREDQCRFAA